MEIRNLLFRTGTLKSVSFDVPIISVGNLSVGGTGKTPFVKFLIHLLKAHNVAVLSRGYGRRTKGYKVVFSESAAHDVGDEPLEIKRAFPAIPVCVCENRVLGIAELLIDFPTVDLIILDDAFQHQYVKPKVSFLLSTAQRPFYGDYVMPMGRLREFRHNYKRANAVVFTNVPQSWTPETKLTKDVFLANRKYGKPKHVYGTHVDSIERGVLVTGIANANLLAKEIGHLAEITTEVSYPDHHVYTALELKELASKLPGRPWVTTAKDWVKIEPILTANTIEVSVFVIQMELEIEEAEKFQHWLTKKLANG